MRLVFFYCSSFLSSLLSVCLRLMEAPFPLRPTPSPANTQHWSVRRSALLAEGDSVVVYDVVC